MGLSLLLHAPVDTPINVVRQVQLSNVLSFIFCWVAVGIALIFHSIYGWMNALLYIFTVAFLFLLVIPLNRLSHRTGRVLFCLIPVWLTLFVTLYFKLELSTPTYITYFDSRFIIMATVVLPGIVFRLQERIQLVVCIGSSLVALFTYDPLHELLGVGYFQMGFNEPSYYYINYIVSVTTLVLVFGIILMRSMLEKSETNLVKQNATLQAKQDEIEAQHEELLQQQEEVLSSNEKLDQANRFILQQQKKLEQYNEQLQVLVQEKSRELIEANNQLIRHNNEMVEFSHAVSHHLRAPVARMLGLSHLLKLVDTEAERKGLGELVFTSSKDLDAVLRDLSTIIDIRHHLYVREDLLLKEDWDAVMRERSPVNASSYSCQVDFSSAPVISGIRPMVRSIFYHALSNCIRFRSARHLQIGVTSEEMEGRINVSITDNGLGFDAMAHSADLFKLYKKFHPAISGKGLGLYMIKAQMEAMGGEAMLTSKAGEGTTLMLQFRVH